MAFTQDFTGQQFGNYRLVHRIGMGGFATVYLGQHVRLPAKQAAIKILDLRDVDEQQFQQEAETTERLVHPNIVRLLDFDASCRKACKPLWHFATGNSMFSSPAVADGVVYVGSWDHNLHAFGLVA